jgi:hypothetical protein
VQQCTGATRPTWQMNKVMANPATGSPHRYPVATRASPVRAPREEIASSHECRASAIRVSEPIRLPTRRLYHATAWLPAMPSAAPAMPSHTSVVVPCPVSLR